MAVAISSESMSLLARTNSKGEIVVSVGLQNGISCKKVGNRCHTGRFRKGYRRLRGDVKALKLAISGFVRLNSAGGIEAVSGLTHERKDGPKKCRLSYGFADLSSLDLGLRFTRLYS